MQGFPSCGADHHAGAWCAKRYAMRSPRSRTSKVVDEPDDAVMAFGGNPAFFV
jgi:hypothetical protein